MVSFEQAMLTGLDASEFLSLLVAPVVAAVAIGLAIDHKQMGQNSFSYNVLI
jgi:hypothetical protein